MSNENKEKFLDSLIEISLDYLSKVIQSEKERVYEYLSYRNKSKIKILILLKILIFVALCFFVIVNFENIVYNLLFFTISIASLPFINILVNEALETDKYSNIKNGLRTLDQIDLGFNLIIQNKILLKRFNINLENKKSKFDEIFQDIQNLNLCLKSKFSRIKDNKIIEIIAILVTIIIFLLNNINFHLDIELISDIAFLSLLFVFYFFLDNHLTSSHQILDVNNALKLSLERKLIIRLEETILFFRNLSDNIYGFPGNSQKLDKIFEDFKQKRRKQEVDDQTLFKYFY